MVGISKKTGTGTTVGRQSNRRKGSTASSKDKENSFVSSTPALGSTASQFQFLTSPIPMDGEESMNWISGDAIIFKTPKAPSPVRTRRRTTMINFQKPLLNEASASSSTDQNGAIFSPPGVKTRSRRSSIYTALKQREIEIAGREGGIAQTGNNNTTNPNHNQPAKRKAKNIAIGENKNGNTQEIDNTKKLETTILALDQSQSVKRKVTEVKIPQSLKRSRKSQVKTSDVEEHKIQVIDKTNSADIQQSFEFKKQNGSLQSIQKSIDVRSPDMIRLNHLSAVDKSQTKMITKDEENFFVTEKPQSIVKDLALPDKTTNGSLIQEKSKSFQAASEDLYNPILNQHMISETELLSGRKSSHHQGDTGFSVQSNLDTTSESRAKKSNLEIKVTGVKENADQMGTVPFELEDGENDLKVLHTSRIKQSPNNVLKNITVSNITISKENTSEVESMEDEQDNWADITVGYSTLSQRCTIL